jgi:Protein of unknown function (DUF2946)
MFWFRTRSKLGSYIALLALAFQLVVAFGHVHLEGLGAHSSATIEASDNTAPAPADHDGPGRADPYCTICALIHLAGAVAPPEPPPSIPLPVVFGRWRPDAVVKFGWTASPPAFFPARAPPLA